VKYTDLPGPHLSNIISCYIFFLYIFENRVRGATFYSKMLLYLCSKIIDFYCILIFGFSLQMSDTLIQFYKMRVGYFYGAQVDQIDFSSILKVLFRSRLVTIIWGSRRNSVKRCFLKKKYTVKKEKKNFLIFKNSEGIRCKVIYEEGPPNM
jgi:hypothetical protein